MKHIFDKRFVFKIYLELLTLSNYITKIMASCPTTSWQIDGETVETMTDFKVSLEGHSGFFVWQHSGN